MPSQPSNIPRTLTEASYQQAIADLTWRDAHLAEVVARWGEPPFWIHAPGFPGLVLAILAQQVSVESAQAAYTKLENQVGAITPGGFMTLDGETLKAIGFSRQKAGYVRGLTQAILEGMLDLEALEALDDDQVRNRLIAQRGIGPWTADTYLLFALRRADAWPSGDLALIKAIQDVRGLATMPTWEAVDAIADGWRPWRAVAARILWHHYLSQRGRK